MYYYIFMPPEDRKTKRLYEKIKLKIGLLGISGEMVQNTPLRTVEELTELGLTKGYNTIIAIGKDSFINKVAHFLINISLAQGKENITFGAIPIEYNESKISQMLKINNLNEAIENLRNRHLKKFDVALIEPNKFFILPIEVCKNKPFYCNLSTKTYFIKTLAKKIKITPSLRCKIMDIRSIPNLFQKATKFLFSAQRDDKYTSSFRAKSFSIESNELIPIQIDNEILAKTPIKLHTIPKLLQLIVPRDKISVRNN